MINWKTVAKALKHDKDLLRKRLREMADIRDLEVDARPDGFHLLSRHWATRVFAESFQDSLLKEGAPNYLEMKFNGPAVAPGGILVTVQRYLGKTPGDLKQEAEARADELMLRVGELERRLPDHERKVASLGERAARTRIAQKAHAVEKQTKSRAINVVENMRLDGWDKDSMDAVVKALTEMEVKHP